MQVEKQTFTSFEKLLNLLQIPQSENILNFDNGRLQRYENPRDFEYGFSNLYEEVLTKISNLQNKERFVKAAEVFIVFAENLRVMMRRIFRGRL